MSVLLRVIPLVLILLLLDYYAFQAFRISFATSGLRPWITGIYWGVHILFYLGIMVMLGGFFIDIKIPHSAFSMLVTTLVILYIPKLFIIPLLLGEDVVRAFTFAGRKVIGLFGGPEPVSEPLEVLNPITRAKFLSQAGIVLAAIPFAGLLYGVIKGKYDFTVRKVILAIKDLPEAFQGFTITQVSDIHTGSLHNFDAIQCGIDLANEQKSDVIFFTGDLVNLKSDEVSEEHEKIFSQLSAPLGVYSILGNHDYGDYARDWKDEREKVANMQNLFAIQERMGWKLLRNQNHILEREGAKIAIVGVENWSSKMSFGQRGDLVRALKGCEDCDVKLLLSHDPSHWDAEIRPKFPQIAATFSGHTHGFQMGIDLPGFKWSPVQYVYKQWAGLYQEGSQYLYVNRGFGFHAYAGRLGVLPEITVFTLEKV